jgi:hypothetical protein
VCQNFHSFLDLIAIGILERPARYKLPFENDYAILKVRMKM